MKKLLTFLVSLAVTFNTIPQFNVIASDTVSIDGPSVLPYNSSDTLLTQFHRLTTKKLAASATITKQPSSTDNRKARLILAEYDNNRAMISSRLSEEITIPNNGLGTDIQIEKSAKTTGMICAKAFLWYEDNTAAAPAHNKYAEKKITELITNKNIDAMAIENSVTIAGTGNVDVSGTVINGERAVIAVILGEYDGKTPFYNLDAVYFDEVDITDGAFKTSFLLGEEDYGTYTVLVNAPSFTKVAQKKFSYKPIEYHNAYAEPIDAVEDALLPINSALTSNTWEHLEFKTGTPEVSYNVDFGDGAEKIGCIVRTAFAENSSGSLYMMIDGEEVGEITPFNNGTWGSITDPSVYKARHFYVTKPELCVGKKTVTFTIRNTSFGALNSFQFFTSEEGLDIGDPMYYDAYSQFPSNSGYSKTSNGVRTKRYALDFGDYSGSLVFKIHRKYPVGSTSSRIEIKDELNTLAVVTPYYVSETNSNASKTIYVPVNNAGNLQGKKQIYVEETGTNATSYEMQFVKTVDAYSNLLSKATTENINLNNVYFGTSNIEAVSFTYTNGGSVDVYCDNTLIESFSLPTVAQESTASLAVRDASKYSAVMNLEFRLNNGVSISNVKFVKSAEAERVEPNFDLILDKFTASSVSDYQGVTLSGAIKNTNVDSAYAKWEKVDFGEEQRLIDVSLEYASSRESSGGLVTLYIDQIKPENKIAEIVAESRYGLTPSNTKTEIQPLTAFPVGVHDLIVTVTDSEYSTNADIDIYSLDFILESSSGDYRTYSKKISKYNETTGKNEIKTLKTFLSYSNYNDTITDAAFVMAVYDEDMKLAGADYVPFDISVGYNSAVAEVPYSCIEKSKEYTVKGFIWNNSNLSPLINDKLDLTEISSNTYTTNSSTVSQYLTGDNIYINAFGDSITMGQYVSPETSYHDFWEEEYNIVSNNYGKGGSSVSTWSDSVGWDSFVKRVGSLNTSADIVFIMGGTNDCMRNVSLGNINSTDTTTFYGGYNTILSTIQENFPNKQIVLATPLYYKTWNNAKNIKIYADAVKAIGKKYNLPVIDLLVDDLDYRNKGTGFLSDELHPTYYGHSLIGDYILDELFDMGILVEADDEENYGELIDSSGYAAPQVTNFYKNKEAAVTLTFDDAYIEAGKYFNGLFKKLDIKGTAMMVSDYVENEDGETVELWQNIIDDGYIEVGSHSKTHKFKYYSGTYTPEELVEDITGGYNILKGMFPNEKILTFAPPWTQQTSESLAETKKTYYSSRGGGGGFVDALPADDVLFNLPAHVVTMPNDTVEGLNGYIDNAIDSKKWYIELLHGVSDTLPTSTSYDIYKSYADKHFAYIASLKDKVWVATLGEMTAYIYEHRNADIEYQWVRENAMSVSVTDGLDNQLFDVPLTIKIQVPASWKNVTVTQRENVTDAVCTNGYVYIDAIPDNGAVLIEKN